MAKQAERRALTRTAILKAAQQAFGGQGFNATTMDAIAAASGVAKGAVYHHYPNKEALFEAVFDRVSAELAAEAAEASRQHPDVLAAMVAGIRHYFTACSSGPRARIVLRDAPAVLGWERWREIDDAHFGGVVPRALEAAMAQGLMTRQAVEPVARLLLGAVTEAAMACSGRNDLEAAVEEYTAALATLIEALRR
jgi:AcrR family transcriptional regulator